MGRIQRLPIVGVICLVFLTAGICGCETTMATGGTGDAAGIDEMRRSIVDLEKKLSALTREIAELEERTARNEKALDAYVSGTMRKPVEEEPVVEPSGKDVPAPETAAAPPGDTAPAVEGRTGEEMKPPAETGVSPSGSAKDSQALYDRALAQVMDRKAETALPLFVEFVKAYPDDDLTDNAAYWIGECYYLMSDYDKALAQFKEVTERFPDKDKAPDALLKMGFCYENAGNPEEARKTYEKVITTFPESPAADLAREKMK